MVVPVVVAAVWLVAAALVDTQALAVVAQMVVRALERALVALAAGAITGGLAAA
jgi:hypothetical protein